MEADTLEPWPINTAFGAQATQQNLYHELSASFPDAVLHIGDISYAVCLSFLLSVRNSSMILLCPGRLL